MFSITIITDTAVVAIAAPIEPKGGMRQIFRQMFKIPDAIEKTKLIFTFRIIAIVLPVIFLKEHIK